LPVVHIQFNRPALEANFEWAAFGAGHI
jgi:hypothetical protein